MPDPNPTPAAPVAPAFAAAGAAVGMWVWERRTGSVVFTAEAVRLLAVAQRVQASDRDGPFRRISPYERRAIARLLRGGRPFRTRVRYRHPDGRELLLEVEADAAPAVNDGPAAMIGTVREIDRPAGDWAEPIGALAQLGDVLDMSPFALCYIDAQRRVRYMNAFGGRLHGRPLDALVGRRVWEYMRPGAFDIIEPCVEMVLAGEVVRSTFEFPFIGVGLRPIDLIYVPHADERGRPVGYLSVVLEAGRGGARGGLRASGGALSAARHDLRQPLGAARLFTDLLGREPIGARGQALVDDLRAALASASGVLAAADARRPCAAVALAPLLERLAREFAPQAEGKGLRLRARGEATSILADETALARILRNLLTNAIAYTDRGGVLIACRARRPGLRIEVWDTGRGIAPAELKSIFRPRQRGAAAAAAPGEGLGLAIARALARQMGFRLQISSRPGRGSRFSLLVPKQACAAAAPAPSRRPRARRRRATAPADRPPRPA